MQRFRFKARNKIGDLKKGVVEAGDKKAAVEVLRNRDLYIIDLNKEGQGLAFMSMFEKVKFEDVVNFTRQLSTMIGAGLPLTDSLDILQAQAKPVLEEVIEDLLRSIEGGASFGDALAEHGEVFSDVYIALVRAGEAAGVLDTVLSRLADNLEKQREFRAKTKGALIYPVIVLIGMTLVGIVMMIFVLPKMTAMYEDFDAELPMVTKILMGISDFMVKSWWIFVVVVFGFLWALRQWRKTDFGGRKVDELILKVPLYGEIKEQLVMAEFTRTLSLLVASGVALVEGLEIVKGVVGNRVYADALKEIVDEVEKGNPLASSLAKHKEFPILVSQMTAVGEQTGKLDEILERIAGYYESEAEHAVKNLSTAMEPIIMVILGLGVGFMIVAIIVPIYNLTSAF